MDKINKIGNFENQKKTDKIQQVEERYFRISAENISFFYPKLPNGVSNKDVICEVLKYFQDAFFLCTCLKIHPDGTKDFLVYLKKRIGKYELRQADE